MGDVERACGMCGESERETGPFRKKGTNRTVKKVGVSLRGRY